MVRVHPVGVLDLIGGTPMLDLSPLVGRRGVRLLAKAELANPGGEPTLAHPADLQPKATQDAPDAQLDVQELGLQELAPDQQGPDLLRRW